MTPEAKNGFASYRCATIDLSMADSDLITVPSCEGKNTQKKGKTR